jgi:hypothetical protein
MGPALEVALVIALVAANFPTASLLVRVWWNHTVSKMTPTPEQAIAMYKCDSINADVNRTFRDLQPLMEARQKGTFNQDAKLKSREVSLLVELEFEKAKAREEGCSSSTAANKLALHQRWGPVTSLAD